MLSHRIQKSGPYQFCVGGRIQLPVALPFGAKHGDPGRHGQPEPVLFSDAAEYSGTGGTADGGVGGSESVLSLPGRSMGVEISWVGTDIP